ncbi:MAG: carbohydrate ABC transporter permease [Ruminococcus sp.]|nr:carbohydrate ABC transporter permease [Ruminococcus sp.]
MNVSLLFQQYGNSLVYALGTALLATLVAVPTSYAMARWDSVWMKMLFWCCVVLLFLPFQVTMLPEYVLLEFLHLLDTRLAILIPGMVSPLPILILWMGNKQVPGEFEDAFCLESGSLLSYFRFVLLPNLSGVIAAAFAICFLLNWNLVDPALIFLEDKGLWPLSLTLLEQEGTARLYYGILDMVPVVLLLGVVMVVMRKRSMK